MRTSPKRAWDGPSCAAAGSVDARLSVECNGDTLRLKARDGGSPQAKDSDFAAGRSGLLVIGEKMAGTSAVFDDFVLAQ